MQSDLKKFLKTSNHSNKVDFKVIDEFVADGFRRLLIEYSGSDGDLIPAYLFVPKTNGRHPAVLIHHQHNGERHLGKSEVAGLKGDPLQAFGPALAQNGFVVLAPDSICFEDRRRNRRGTEPDEGDRDWLQHFNELTYRLVKGDTLMRKVLDDGSIGLSLLFHAPFVDRDRLGVFGHSYGGNTTLFQAALDDRVRFACSSGAACSFENKMASETPFEFALAVPGFCIEYDIWDLVKATAPRKLLIVSASDDKYSKDAGKIVGIAKTAFEELKAVSNLQHKAYEGGHALTQERFQFICDWIAGH